MVPILAENCFLGCALLHSHMRRVAMNRTSDRPHVGQHTPSGQRSSTIVLSVTSGSAKWRIASTSVWGSALMGRTLIPPLTEPSMLLPKFLGPFFSKKDHFP
jgi:hypothetical protein